MLYIVENLFSYSLITLIILFANLHFSIYWSFKLSFT